MDGERFLRLLDGRRGDAPHGQRRQRTAVVRRGDVDDPIHKRQRLEEVIRGHLAPQLRPHSHLVKRDAGDRIPQRRPRLNDLELGVQPPHAVADEDEMLHRWILPLRIEALDRRRQLAAEHGRGLEERGPGRIVEKPGLEALLKPGVDAELVEEIEPGSLVAPQAVDEDHRDAARAVGLEELDAGAGSGAPVRQEEVHGIVVGRHPAEHVEERRRQIGGEEGAGGPEIDRRDLHRIDEVEDRGGVIARQRPRKRFEDVLVGRHREPQHGRRRQALALRRKDPVAFPIGRCRHAHAHRQAETAALMAAMDPFVAGRGGGLDMLDRRGGDLHPPHLDRHDDRPPLRPDKQPAAIEPLVRRRRLKQSLKRAGVELRRLADELGIARAQPQRIPSCFGGGEVAVDRPAISLRGQLRRLLGIVASPGDMAVGLLVYRHLGIGHRQRERLRQPLHLQPLRRGISADARQARGHDQHQDLLQQSAHGRVLRHQKRGRSLDRGQHALLVSAPAGSAQQEECPWAPQAPLLPQRPQATQAGKSSPSACRHAARLATPPTRVEVAASKSPRQPREPPCSSATNSRSEPRYFTVAVGRRLK